MLVFPILKKIQTREQLEQFSEIYASYSGLPIPKAYLENNQVFAVFHHKNIVGGFILGNEQELRTVQVFAKDVSQNKLKEQLTDATEITCFWIHKKFQTKTFYNSYVWIALLYCLKKYAQKNIVFGTNSRRLGMLYSASSKIECLHLDYINHKKTFIFKGTKQDSFKGIFNILNYKLKRTIKIYLKLNKLKRISLGIVK